MSQNKTDITDTTLCAVPAPLPPNSPEAWYAPQVRSQHEVTPGVIITIIDQADHVGFRYQIREPSLDTDSEDALAEIRAYFAGANLEGINFLNRDFDGSSFNGSNLNIHFFLLLYNIILIH